MKLENPQQAKVFKKRRQRLAAGLENGVVVLPTAPERSRNADTHYDYRWDSGFYYLTGFREPEAVLVMTLGSRPRSFLFCREKNLEREIWDGYRHGPRQARELRSEERRVGKECRSRWSPEQAEDGIRDGRVTGVQTCALPISIRITTTGGTAGSTTSPASASRRRCS